MHNLCLNLATAAGADIVRELVWGADVLVQNLSPGAGARRPREQLPTNRFTDEIPMVRASDGRAAEDEDR